MTLDSELASANEVITKYRQARRKQVLLSRAAIRNSRNRGFGLTSSRTGRIRKKTKWAKAPLNSCPVFKTVYDSFPDTDEKTRWALADSYCKQADKYKIANAHKMNLTQLMNTLKDAQGGQKQAYSPDNDTENPQSKAPSLDTTGDKDSPASKYESLAECRQKMAADYPGISPDSVETQCQKAFGNGGPAKNSKSSRVKQATIALEEYESKVPHWILASRYTQEFKNHQGLLAQLRDAKEQDKTIQTNIKNAASDTTPHWVKTAQNSPYHKAMSEIRDEHEAQYNAYSNIKSGSTTQTEKAIPSSENIPYWIRARQHIMGQGQ